MSEAQVQVSKSKDVPRYQLTEKAYIDDVLYDPETRPIDPETEERKPLLINFSGIPGPHMIPVNAAAKAMVEKHQDIMSQTDLIHKLPVMANNNAGAQS